LFRSAQAPTSPPAEHASRGRYCATCSHKSTPTPTTHAYPKSKNSPGTPPQRRATTPTATATAGTTQPPEPSGVPRARHLGKPRRYLQQGALCPPVDGPAGAGAGPPTGWTPGPTGGRPHTGSAAPPALRDTAPPHRPHARARPHELLTLDGRAPAMTTRTPAPRRRCRAGHIRLAWRNRERRRRDGGAGAGRLMPTSWGRLVRMLLGS